MILAIDYGLKKIGLAISEGLLASPLQVIKTKKWEKLLPEIFQKENIEKIIVGISENQQTEIVKSFIEDLKKITALEIIIQDETLTTKEAIGNMIASGKSKKYRQGMEDAVSACLILQSYLDNNVIARSRSDEAI